MDHRFAKNLSPDQINLSTLKGEGHLTNLELDEEVLQSLLDLPTWLAINRVCCNKATIRVSDATARFGCLLSGFLGRQDALQHLGQQLVSCSKHKINLKTEKISVTIEEPSLCQLPFVPPTVCVYLLCHFQCA